MRWAILMLLIVAAAGCATVGQPGVTLPEPHTGNADAPIWGVRNGIVVGVPPARIGFGRDGGPRGLIRVGFEENGKLYFINFLADAPITPGGHIGQSELDHSPSDYAQGIRIFPYPTEFHDHFSYWRDREPPRLPNVATIRPGGNQAELDLVFRYETFPNGAKPYFSVHLRADRPHEVAFFFYHEAGTVEMNRNVLSSTFSNLARDRLLYLRDRIVNAHELWPAYRGANFAPIEFYPLAQLRRNREGDVIFAVRPDEERPWDGYPNYPHQHRLTQYWRKPHGTFDESLHGGVNGRYVYWKSTRPVPGGIAYENVGLVENFLEGQVQIFGYHFGEPEELFR
jgi:hypothetical protein